MTVASVTITSAAASLPISLAEAKRHLRITHDAENDDIESKIRSVTAWAETHTGRFFITRTCRVQMDRFPYASEYVAGTQFAIEDQERKVSLRARSKSQPARSGALYLPGGRVTQVLDITYFDADGVQQTLTGPTSAVAGTDYQEDLSNDEAAWVYPPRSGSWPAVQADRVNAVSINYKAGYSTDADDVPDDIRAALLTRLADLYQVRGTADAGNRNSFLNAAEALLFPYTLHFF